MKPAADLNANLTTNPPGDCRGEEAGDCSRVRYSYSERVCAGGRLRLAAAAMS